MTVSKSTLPPASAFIFGADATTTLPPIFVLVFAHPDDESMFFLPTIRSLVDAGQTVWFLCLTSGGYDGLGKIREKELEKAGKLLGASRVIVRSDDDNKNNDDNDNEKAILDHPTKRYDKKIVASAIRDSLSKNLRQTNDRNNTNTHKNRSGNRFVLITFDELGVSGHVNHIDTYLGVSLLMEEQDHQQQTNDTNSRAIYKEENESLQQQKQELCFLEAWHLESKRNVLSKYIPLLSWIFLVLTLFSPKKYVHSFRSIGVGCRDNNTTGIRVFRMHNPMLNWKAMATHRSQFVWYRRLFVVFSSYTYCNKYICKTPTRLKRPRPNSKN
mmetsp:Transcript_2853/g.6065  ORF Transcript_2853/g.6065 Transcript_2853/m.6065 type:complete len:328 (+) Transcript_2853:34-1017(+)